MEVKKTSKHLTKNGGKKNHHNSQKKRGGKNKKWLEKNRILGVKNSLYGSNMLWLEAHS